MTTFYTDSTTPTAMTAAVKGNTGYNVGIADKILYALYEDSATWTAWTAWAQSNALNSNNVTNFSSMAIEVKGMWGSLRYKNDANEDTWAKSFMCMEDKGSANNRGGWCVEAKISTASSTTTYDSETYRAVTADFKTTVEDVMATPPGREVVDWAFAATHSYATGTANKQIV